jgi:uncharacterized lipoprotein YddW (UPF0748 family)
MGFMISASLRSGWRRRAGIVVAAALVVCWTRSAAHVSAQEEVRALWVVRTSLTSPAAVASMVSAAKASGFNALLVQVRGRADAYYANGLEPRPSSIASQPAFDPLAMTIARAHEAGLQVHAWINVQLVASANELPAARDHIVYRHPEWLMVPRALGDDLASVDPRSPEYLGRLTRYARSRPGEIEGLYLSPIPAAAADYTVAVVRDIVDRYAVDGVHFDYARYPTDDFDYSRNALAAFHANLAPDLTAAGPRLSDEQRANEPTLSTRLFPERWRLFRMARLTDLIGRLKETVRAARPHAVISAAVGPDPVESAARRLQDWRSWLERDLVDVVCPMAYTTDGAVFASQIAAARDLAGRHPVWAGIGAYLLTPRQIADNVSAARRLGVGGIILFSYDSLTNSSRGPDYLAQVGRSIEGQK